MARQKWMWGTLAALAVACVANTGWGQFRGPGGPGGGGFGFGGGGGGLSLLQDENIRKDLELVDDQVAKLRALGEKLGQEMRSVFSDLRDLPRDASEEERQKRRDEMQTKIRERTESIQKEIDAVLLPQQRERLKQVALQSRMRYQSTADVIASGEVADALQLTDAQKEALRKAQEESQTELREKMDKLREEARDKILKVLTPEQQAKFKALIGPKAEFSAPQFGGGFGNRGPGGGPGGTGGRPLQRPADGD